MLGLDGLIKGTGAKALAPMLKPHIPDFLRLIVDAIIREGGGDPEKGHAAALRFKESPGQAQRTIIADIYELDAMEEPHRLIGSVDVIQAADRIDLAKFL